MSEVMAWGGLALMILAIVLSQPRIAGANGRALVIVLALALVSAVGFGLKGFGI